MGAFLESRLIIDVLVLRTTESDTGMTAGIVSLDLRSRILVAEENYPKIVHVRDPWFG